MGSYASFHNSTENTLHLREKKREQSLLKVPKVLCRSVISFDNEWVPISRNLLLAPFDQPFTKELDQSQRFFCFNFSSRITFYKFLCSSRKHQFFLHIQPYNITSKLKIYLISHINLLVQ